MEVSVSNQAFIFLCFVLGGFSIGIIYDFIKSISQTTDFNNIITFILDIVFWIFVTIIIFILVFVTNDGELRWYEFLGAILGIILYNMLLSTIISNIFLFIFKLFRNIIYYVIIIPVKFILNLMLIPCKIIYKITKKETKKIKKIINAIDNKIYMFTKKINIFIKKN